MVCGAEPLLGGPLSAAQWPARGTGTETVTLRWVHLGGSGSCPVHDTFFFL